MSWKPTASHAALRRRADMLDISRQFFKARDVLEVETPILSSAAVSDPQLESLSTRIAGFAQPFYAQTSPEYAMKRLLAAGSGDIYQICKVFRDAERGRWHNPEFTMLEWYRLGFDDDELMTEVETLVKLLLAPMRAVSHAERLTYAEALAQHAQVEAHTADEFTLSEAARRHGVEYDGALDRDAKLDLLMGMVVGPKLGHERPCFICDYPASQAALAQLKPRNHRTEPLVAARFELYLDGIELANGFHELREGAEQRQRFGHDLTLRKARGQAEPPLDERFLSALEAGLPNCAGVAMGFDRLVAIALGATQLADAMAFDIDNA